MTRYEKMVKEDWRRFAAENAELLPNILVLGASGCGKSSLINTVFGREVAQVNDTSRGTSEFTTYSGKDHGIGINLIDSRGYEMEDKHRGETFAEYRNAIEKLMEENRIAMPNGRIHIVWYCVSVAANRIQRYDTDCLRMLWKDPQVRERTAAVFTKCDQDDEDGSTATTFRGIIAEDVNPGMPVFEVSDKPALPLDLDNLIMWSADQLDDADRQEADLDLRECFVAAQTADLELKKQTAQKRIGVYTAAAAGIAFTPIPFSDAALLTPMQAAMAAHIVRIYGIDNFANVSTSLLGDVVVANLGRSLAGGIMKLVPGIGTIGGGLINAGVASLITSAIGYAVSTISYNTCRRLSEGRSVDWSDVFTPSEIQHYANSYMSSHKQNRGASE